MDSQLNNIASAVGNYNGIPTSLTSAVSVVSMVEGLTITKTADKQSWADGLLTYTITVENGAGENYVAPVVTDVLDTTLVDFVEDSVTINGTKATTSQYTYNADTHTLTVNLSDITPSASSTIQFQVKKKA